MGTSRDINANPTQGTQTDRVTCILKRIAEQKFVSYRTHICLFTLWFVERQKRKEKVDPKSSERVEHLTQFQPK